MHAAETFVHLSDYPEPETDEFFALPFNEQYKLEDYHAFTREATAVKPGRRVISHLYCEEEDVQGDLCGGDIELVRSEKPPEIRWNCLRCGQHGKITGFINGESDLSYLPKETARQFIEDTYGVGLETDEESGLGFADFLDIEGVLEDFDGDFESFLDWFMDLPVEEQENFLIDMGVDFDALGPVFIEMNGGLDPMQLYELLAGDWVRNEGPMRLNRDLTAKEISGSILFHNARTMLLKAQKEDGLSLTQKGNLQRKVITELIPDCIWPDGYLETVKRYNKVVNEHDIWLLHSTRVLLEIAGLLHKHKGKLKAVKKHSELSLGSRSGKLYRELFTVYFKKINISYLTNNMFHYPNVQENVPFALYRLHQLADDWIPISELMEKIFLPMAYNDIDEQTSYFMKPEWYVYSLMLKPLELFGLVETREPEDVDDWAYQPDQCRKTPLFDKFISFRF